MQTLLQHRHILKQLSKRFIQERYRGSMLGVLWSLATPLLMLGIYTFVFSFVFKARWNMDTGSQGSFAIILFSGLILHQFFVECITTASTVVIQNQNFVKKVIFPLEVLVPALVSSAFFQLCICYGILLLAMFFLWHEPITYLAALLPLLLIPFLLLTLGISWIIASLGVYIRDIAQMMAILGSILFFMSTILFPAEILPEAIRPLLYLNPLSFMADSTRQILLFQTLPNWSYLGLYTAISVITFGLGFVWFQKTRRGFADVL